MDNLHLTEFLGEVGGQGEEVNDRGPLVLSYKNSCLYEADVKLLERRGWINDEVVGFVLEYFANDQFKEISEDICFISPQVSQFIKLYQGCSNEEISELLKPLDLSNKKYIIVPVNDSVSAISIGGTHWSIMAYSKDVKKVYYLDSLDGYNREHANVLQRRIGIHLKAFKDAPLAPVRCPQQPNLWDCGLYALCFAEEVCNGLLKKREDFYNVSFDAGHAASARERIKETIHRLAQK